MKFDPRQFDRIAFWVSLAGLIAIVSDFGFSHDVFFRKILYGSYFLVLAVGLASTFSRYFHNRSLFWRKAFLFDLVSVGFTLWVFSLHLLAGPSSETGFILRNPIWVKIAVLLTFIRELFERKINFKRAVFNPAQLLIVSFLLMIFIGSLLLLLPRATHHGISYVDALFTSTSAICVTGLAVVDTGKHFTQFGQTIIMILIQLGGLGILTFASYFSYFFKGGSTYENQLVLSDITDSKKLGEVFSTLKHIILITFGIEFVAGFFIYVGTASHQFGSPYDRLFFSAFHAVSAFCNAGFTTLEDGLYNIDFRFNYFLHIVILLTFLLGGLGFPIVVNILRFLRYRLTTLVIRRKKRYRPWVLNIDSRINLITTLSILLISFVVFWALERDNTLSEHRGLGKAATALFGAATPRSSGFNTIDTSALSFPALLMVFVLMWIGGSPQSTGGGIKTGTFAIAVLNVLSLAKGKSRIEIFRREISEVSVRRAFAIITLSFVVIGFAILALAASEPDKRFREIAFECFSAYSTTGLSLGITGALSDSGKLVITLVMFVGRISALSFFIAVVSKMKYKNYRYPKEEITIN